MTWLYYWAGWLVLCAVVWWVFVQTRPLWTLRAARLFMVTIAAALILHLALLLVLLGVPLVG